MLVEIMMVVMIIGALTAIGVPTWNEVILNLMPTDMGLFANVMHN